MAALACLFSLAACVGENLDKIPALELVETEPIDRINAMLSGCTLYTYLQNMTEMTGVGDNLKILSYDGVAPSAENIADGSYSLSDGYYAVVRGDLPEDHSARAVIEWLCSEDGQENLLHHMGRIFMNNTPPPGTVGRQTDKKLRQKIRQKKIAMGHKPDDHEEQTYSGPTMSM